MNSPHNARSVDGNTEKIYYFPNVRFHKGHRGMNDRDVRLQLHIRLKLSRPDGRLIKTVDFVPVMRASSMVSRNVIYCASRQAGIFMM